MAADEAKRAPQGTPQDGDAAGEPRPTADPAGGEADTEREPGDGRPASEGSAGSAGAGGAADGADSAVDADLEALLADVTRERDEYLDLARRAKADFENFKKRTAQQVTDAAKRAKGELAGELLPVLDALERALEAAAADEGVAKGVALVRDQLLATLERAGVEAYDPAGEKFDPSWHEALSTRAQEDTEPGVVLETVDRGYRLDGQVLRPARVVVSE